MWKVYVEMIELTFLFITSCYCNSGVLNVDDLVREYSNACGHMFLCSELEASSYPYYHQALNRCPKCSCEDDCFSTNTCCPDKFFKSKFQVFTNFLLGSADRESYQKYEVIVSCPDGANPSAKAECQTSLTGYQWTKTPPVTSLATNLSYSNRYCASCHGEALDDLVFWDLGFGKGDLPNIAYLISPFEELIKLGEMLQIPFLFSPSHQAKNIVKQLPSMYLLPPTCPTDADPNIKKACESSYFLPFRFHQNIFCYLCNIPKIKNSDSVIKICNVTGHWDAKDLTLKDACANKGTSAMTYPYKNAYCFFCNTISNPLESFSPPPEGRDVIHFYDIYFEYEEKHSVDWSKKEKHEIKIKNVVFRNEKMNLNILNTKIENTDIRLLDNGMYRWKGNLIDIKSLVQRKVAMHPDRVCDLSLLPESIRQFTLTNCDCDIDCIFRNVCSCCIDAALQSSATCLSNTLHVESSSNSEEVEIIVIDGCSRNEGYMYFHQYRKLCEDDTGDFSSYFVHYGSATYKNVFCFFCNSNVFRLGQKILHNNFTPLDLNIVCPSFFHFLYTGSINAVINSAKDNGCSVFYDTDKTTKCRKEEEDYSYGGFWASSYYSYYHDYSQSEEKIEIVNICNSSGKVVNDIDLNVRWACENISDQAFPSVSGFKNEFCLLCNVIESVQTLKDKCDPGSFNFHPAYSEGCDLLPDVHAVSEVYPYKNSFCFACNNEFCFENKCFPNSSFVIDPADCSGQTGNALRIRKPFVLPKLLPSVVFYTSPHYVTESERYGCFPGRVLVADICELIIMDGIGLYAVDISTKIMINSTIANATIVLQKIEEALKKDIVKLLPGNPGLMTYFSVVPYNNLNLVTESPVQNEQFLMDIYFEIPYANYERDLIEKMLLKLPHEIDQQNSIENDNVEYYIKGLGFSLPKHTLDYGMSDTISYNKFKNRMQSLFSGPPLSVLFVGNLLFCVHRKFNASLFIFDNENMRITSNESLLSFEMGDFAMDFAGFIGVCDYGSRFNSIASDKLVTAFVDIHYLSTVFHGVSAVSMASIFLSYCIFKNLRTPSGINAMFVSLSLCLLHIVGTLEKLLEHINVACTVIGLILHYLWLSVCCSLTVAAFHQCLLFKNYKPKDDLSSSSKEHSPVLFHIIFSFLLPLVVVATNGILLYVFLTDFQYGSDRCFLTHEISNIITYLSPLAISTLLTIFLHFATFKLIISSKEKLNLKRKRTEFFLLFKVAIIVSVIAFLQISQWFISTSTYSFVVDLIISTQGCTIFLAICCSSQIFKLWKTKGENLSESDSTLSLETEKATTTAYAE